METEKKKQGFTLFNTLSLIEGCRLQIINKMNEAKKRKSKSMKKNENYLFAQPDGLELYAAGVVCDPTATQLL